MKLILFFYLFLFYLIRFIYCLLSSSSFSFSSSSFLKINKKDKEDNNNNEKKKKKKNSQVNQPLSCMIIFGSGGHTTEMIRTIQNISILKYSPIYFITAQSDKTSIGKINTSKIPYLEKVQWESIYRSREVKQSWFSTIFTTFYALIQSFYLIWKLKPQVIICNGPGTCVPLCLAAFLLRVLMVSDYLYRPYIIFLESYCRVNTLSLTGRILYNFADKFIVQWKNLQTKYSRAEYIGKIC